MMDEIGQLRPDLGIAWEAVDRRAVAIRLASVLGIELAIDEALAIDGLVLAIRPAPSDRPSNRPVDRLVVVERTEPFTPDVWPGEVALIWATVDLERAMRQLVDAGMVGGPPHPTLDVGVLGARGARAAAGRLGVPLLVLEPATEGRLAATLARHGEGPCGLVIGASNGGLELVPGGSTAGPHLLVGDRRYHPE